MHSVFGFIWESAERLLGLISRRMPFEERASELIVNIKNYYDA